jgi:HAD superfamily hydrolase (TIGR01456 family)
MQRPDSWTGARAWNNWKPLPKGKEIFNPKDPYTTDIPESALKIDHIFVWNDPRDWSVDIQLIHDVLASHKGYLGTVSRKNGDQTLPNNGWQQDGQPCLWISNLDLHWKTQYPINRFGTGAFVEALKGVWRAATDGVELQYKALGKPLQVTYEYAHDKLLHLDRSGADSKKTKPLKRVYMIGDNPESDISGANGFSPADGAEWKSVLVRTGVWAPTDMEPEPRHKPDAIVNDVVDAIVWALNSEGIKMSREELLALGTADTVKASEEETLAEKAKEAVTMPSAPIGRIVA